ncbi:MAG: LysR family transcriptional regulator, partial [Oscillospiraceae bacterium]|nr:LysR family transcriptional regulator [Oscillospiraceae bacterium]
ELGSHNLLIALARIGLGVAGVTEEFAQSGLIRGVICPLRLKEEIPTRYVAMCTLKKVQPSAATLKFMEYIQDYLRKSPH